MFDAILQTLLRKGFKVFQDRKKDLNLNIVAVRSGSPVLDEFRCKLFVFWPVPENAWAVKRYCITTLPGRYYLRERLLNEKGCAILAPGQYPGAWQLGWHRDRYEALVQWKAVQVYRDGNRDAVFDYLPSTLDTGVYGINIHRAGPSGTVPRVGRYSAGCQVFQSADDFSEFITLCRQSRQFWGDLFTYTLLEEGDLT